MLRHRDMAGLGIKGICIRIVIYALGMNVKKYPAALLRLNKIHA